MTVDDLKAFFDLKPLPLEGGYYSEIYRGSELLPASSLPERYSSDKSTMTSIFYLLESGIFSSFHRLKSDEIYHFYMGDPVNLVLLHEDGSVGNVTLGRDLLAGQHLQYVVPKGTWQASYLDPQSRFALLGCTVAPGFDPDDYEHGHWEPLLRKYPAQHAIIMKLTRK